MPFGRFFAFNLVGGCTWVFGLTYLGYFFGRTEIVRKNFGLVVIAIIGISLLPMAFEILRAWRGSKRPRVA
jgi:membrane-associated protein